MSNVLLLCSLHFIPNINTTAEVAEYATTQETMQQRTTEYG